MCFYYLLLGHLLGDFVLQTNKIAENKVKYSKWNILHAVIVTICMLIFSIPFGYPVMFLVLLAGIAHYFIDFYKPKLSVRFPMPDLFYFVADQGIHVLIIYAISAFAVENIKYLLLDIVTVKLLLAAVFVSYFSAILSQYVVNFIFKTSKKKFFEDFEKVMGIITRASLVAGFYLSFFSIPLFFIIVVSVILTMFLCYRYSRWKSWMNFGYFTAKLITDAMMALVCLIFIINI